VFLAYSLERESSALRLKECEEPGTDGETAILSFRSGRLFLPLGLAVGVFFLVATLRGGGP
jgi:hypothetical protein